MYAVRVKPGADVKLKKIDPQQDGGLSKEEGLAKIAKLGERLAELQELLAVSGTHGMLVVFQGMDTAGKDGAINRLLGFVNVQSCRTQAFKVPTPEELSHDFLWRVHSCAPGRGDIHIFNRSHYEDVLVVRVNELVPEEVWKKRYAHINHFEELLADSQTLIVKFFLHITADEQEQRLLDREKDVTKSWKLSSGDWKVRERWDDYQAAYEDALSKCNSEKAPWYIVPANRKWYRDLCIAEVLVEHLEQHEKTWLARLEETGEAAKAELAEYRANLAKGV